MASLLGPFNFGNQKQSYFHAKITIHELNNVPMVEGSFKAKWRVEHVHHLSSAVATGSQLASNALSGAHHGHDPGRSQDVNQKAVRHKQSSSTLASQATLSDPDGSAVDGSSSTGSYSAAQSQLHATGDDDASVEKGSNQRKTSARFRFLSGFRDTFHSGQSSSRSSTPTKVDSGNGEAQSQNSREQQASLWSSQASLKSSSSIATRDEQINDKSLEMDRSSSQGYQESDGLDHMAENDFAPHHTPGKSARASTSLSKDSRFTVPTSSHTHHGAPEPRGETASKSVKDHRVRWERSLDVGVRIPVEKQRLSDTPQNTGPPSTPTGIEHTNGQGSSRSSSSNLRKSVSSRELGGRAQDGERKGGEPRETSNGLGVLGQSELRISVKADVPTGTESHHTHTTIRMGHIGINLAEFAPLPHHSHNHVHSHHHASQGDKSTQHRPSPLNPTGTHHEGTHHHHNHHPHSLTRVETRRYLLQHGTTNATIKVTVEMTHIGGTRDYNVPPNKAGLTVAASGRTSDKSPPDSNVGSESGSVDEGEEGIGMHSDLGKKNSSLDTSRSIPNRHHHGIARKQRIPSSNLTTALSHKDTARAVKEADGGGRLAFSFAAGAHHDHAPEHLVDLLFDPKTKQEHLSALMSIHSYKQGNAPNKGPATQSSQPREDSDPPQCMPSRKKLSGSDTLLPGIDLSQGLEKKSAGKNHLPSARTSAIRWKDHVRHPRHAANRDITPAQLSADQSPTDRTITASPPPMSSDFEQGSNTNRDSESEVHPKHKTSSHDSQPPGTPPDVAHPMGICGPGHHDHTPHAPPALECATPYHVTVSPPQNILSEGRPLDAQFALSKQPSRRTLGMSKEAALHAGYRGAGWGTLPLSPSRSSSSVENGENYDISANTSPVSSGLFFRSLSPILPERQASPTIPKGPA